MIAGFFNVAAFNILSAFAVLTGATSRVVIITYSMPIWATMLSRILIGERLNGIRMLAVGLCIAGLLVLMWPQLEQGLSPSVLLSLGCAWCWAIATVYIKWVKAEVPPLANAAWQLAFGMILIGIGMFYFDGYPRLWPVSRESLIAVLFIGVLGVGLPHFLWWAIVGKLPAVTASIGALLVPVVGVTGSAIILGERPTVPDIIGFALIFAAAACVLLQPNVKHTEMPE
jgi:drug/metabolite transporter (DMT)-like permease